MGSYGSENPEDYCEFWFDAQAEEAVEFYVSIFKDAKIGRTIRYTKEGFKIHGMPEGQEFVALNGGPAFTLNEAVSFVIHCGSEEDLGYYGEKLTEGGDETAQVCGWLKDKFGCSGKSYPVN